MQASHPARPAAGVLGRSGANAEPRDAAQVRATSERADGSFPAARAVAPLLHLSSTSSTNDVLAALWRRDPDGLPALTTVVADVQTRGRGRLGRAWFGRPGASLLASTLVTLPAAGLRVGWVTLIAGLAARAAVAERFAVCGSGTVDVALKWPNDVLVRDRKAAGILGEVVDRRAGRTACAVGLGLNVGLARDELPTPVSTSLGLEGLADTTPRALDAILAAYLRGLRERLARFEDAGGDAQRSGALAELRATCATIGRRAVVHLPDGRRIAGLGAEVTPEGALVLRLPDGALRRVTAGDVELVAARPGGAR